MTSIILSGPTQLDHIKWKNKEFLLFGELHGLYTPKQYDFANFMKIIAEQTNEKKICVDFFVESQFKKHINEDIKKPTHEGESVMKNQMLPYLRYLFSGNNIYSTSNYNYFRIQAWELSQYLFSDAKSSFLTMIRAKVYTQAIHKSENIVAYNFFCNNENNEYDSKYKGLLSIMNRKEVKYIYENEKFISRLVHKQLQNIDREYFCKEQLIEYFSSQLKDENDENIDVRLFVLETYALARMFRNEFKIRDSGYNKCSRSKPENIIYYGGLAHTNNIIKFLNYIARRAHARDELITISTSRKTGYNNEISFPVENYFNLFDSKEHMLQLLGSYNLSAPANHFTQYQYATTSHFTPSLPSSASANHFTQYQYPFTQYPYATTSHFTPSLPSSASASSFTPSLLPSATATQSTPSANAKPSTLKATAKPFIPFASGRAPIPSTSQRKYIINDQLYKNKYLLYKHKYLKLKEKLNTSV